MSDRADFHKRISQALKALGDHLCSGRIVPEEGKVVVRARHPAGLAIIEVAETGGTTIRAGEADPVPLDSEAGQAILEAVKRYSDPGKRGARKACLLAGNIEFESRVAFPLPKKPQWKWYVAKKDWGPWIIGVDKGNGLTDAQRALVAEHMRDVEIIRTDPGQTPGLDHKSILDDDYD